MAQILIRDLDVEVVENLKKRAKQDGRSLQSQVKTILEQVAFESRVDMKTARKICAKYRRSFKGRRFPDTVKLIKDDRKR